MKVKTTDTPTRRVWEVHMTECEAMQFYVGVLAHRMAQGNAPTVALKLGRLLAETHKSIGGPSQLPDDEKEYLAHADVLLGDFFKSLMKLGEK